MWRALFYHIFLLAFPVTIIVLEPWMMPDGLRGAFGQTGSNLLKERENSRADNPWDEISLEASPKKKKFPGYNQYGAELRKWCDLMRRDGRGEEVWHFALSFTEEDPECPACKPFFKTLAASCKEKKKMGARSKADTPEATPTPLMREREPHVAVIKVAGETFASLSEERRASETYIAVKKLAVFLEKSEGKRKGAADYYAAIAPYIIGPFRAHERSQSHSHTDGEPAKSEEERKQSLDSLFEQ